jgi:hypothetical protein
MYEAFVGAIKAAVEAGAIAEPDLVLPANLSRDLLTNPYMLNAARGLDLYRMNGSDDGSLPAVWFNAGCTAWDEDENDDPEACTWHHVKVVQAVADIIAQIPRSSLRGPA